jgi:L,D-peptidoglycan transpeptidase YkuD (ErfK/YbiS/YcfS/YnhG family)
MGKVFLNVKHTKVFDRVSSGPGSYLGRLAYLLLFCLALTPGFAQAAPIPQDCNQLVVVTTQTWGNSNGDLRYFQRTNGRWVRQSGWRVRIGKNGLGWGESNWPLKQRPAEMTDKKEGDGKSPAGLFPILDGFGRPNESSNFPNFPFQAVDKNWAGVDDVKSSYYNQLVNSEELGSKKDWDSAEDMCIPEYLLGLRIGYNTENPVPGNGSCIYVHLFSVPERGTAGCTSMAPANLRKLCKWLKADQHPMILQVPQPLYRKLEKSWNLP